jgi:hypothetical protein
MNPNKSRNNAEMLPATFRFIRLSCVDDGRKAIVPAPMGGWPVQMAIVFSEISLAG